MSSGHFFMSLKTEKRVYVQWTLIHDISKYDFFISKIKQLVDFKFLKRTEE